MFKEMDCKEMMKTCGGFDVGTVFMNMVELLKYSISLAVTGPILIK